MMSDISAMPACASQISLASWQRDCALTLGFLLFGFFFFILKKDLGLILQLSGISTLDTPAAYLVDFSGGQCGWYKDDKTILSEWFLFVFSTLSLVQPFPPPLPALEVHCSFHFFTEATSLAEMIIFWWVEEFFTVRTRTCWILTVLKIKIHFLLYR